MRRIVFTSNEGFLIVSTDGLEPVLPESFRNLPRGLYGATLAERVLDLFYGELVDVRKEFESYYASQYSSFRDFLEWKHDISPKVLDRLEPGPSETDNVGIGTLFLMSDYTLRQWLSTEDGRRLLREFFEFPVETKDENSG